MRPGQGPRTATRRPPLATTMAWVVFGTVGAAATALYVLWWRHKVHGDLTAFEVAPVDGAMQLLNPLARMADGQRPGADFPVFHGIGVPVVHYPIFALFGGDLRASEIARWGVTGAASLVAPAVLIAALTRRLFLVAIAGLAPFLFWPVMAPLLEPRTSEIGVRAAMPLLVVAFLALEAGRRDRVAQGLAGRRLDLGAGVLCGLAVLLGTEHGVAITLATGLVFLITPARGEALGMRGRAVLAFGAAWLVAVLLGALVIAGAGWTQALRYAFVTIPSEQFWYFGTPPNFGLTAWRAFLGTAPFWLIVLSMGSALVLWRARRRLPESWPVLVLVIYGLLSTVTLLAIIASYNYAAVARTLVIAGAWALVVALPRLASVRRPSPTVVLAAIGVWLVTLVLASLPHALVRIDDLKDKPEVRQAGGFWGIGLHESWARHIDVLSRNLGPKPDVWALFGGAYLAERGVMNPTGADYVLQALSDDARREYDRTFAARRPAFALTPRLVTFPGSAGMNFGHWYWHRHWSWYRLLLTHYEPAEPSPFSLIWRRRPGPGIWPAEQVIEARAGMGDEGWRQLPLPGRRSPRELLDVRVEYKTRNVLGSLPVVGRLPRYLLTFEGTVTSTPVSLPPDRSVWDFPVFVADGAVPRIRPVVSGPLPGASLEIERITYRRVALPQGTIRYMLEEGIAPGHPGA